MPPSTLIQSVVSKPSKRKDVFYEMSSTCPVCKLKCSRKDVMLRHKRNKHGTTHPYPQSSDAYPPSSQAYPPPQRVALQHPFTILLCGPTSGGKSCWINKLLTHAKTMINPPPERIIWCYKRWQPLFSEIQQTIKNMHSYMEYQKI